ncbi:Cdc6/Cdc18 family protein [Halobacteriaceae archaeon GCM10025711]
MITNARVLQDEFVPRDIVHRNAEMNLLSSALEPLLDDQPARNAFLFGPTGVGKTVTTRFTLRQLQEERFVEVTEVNCWRTHTQFGVLYSILDELGQTVDIHRQSTPQDELLRRLEATAPDPFIVVLDEVDQLDDPGLLYDLHAIPGVTLVLISNREEELFSRLDDRVNSRLKTGPRIQFDRYHQAELVAILQDRADQGLQPRAVSEDCLARIADAAAGDARVAIGILREAARLADERNERRLTPALVEDAEPKARSSIHRSVIARLTDHQRLLYEIVQEAGTIRPPELYETYRDRVTGTPKSERTVRNYLQKLAHYKLVRIEGETRGRRYTSRQGV